MLKGVKIGFIGGGNMAEAIFSGALAAGAIKPADTFVTDINAARLADLRARYGVQTLPSGEGNAGALVVARRCNLAVLAVKPQQAAQLLADVGPAFAETRVVLSIMGGIGLAALEGLIPRARVVRAMPNTPMLVGRGCAGLAGGTRAGEEDVALCGALFGAVGTGVVLPESLLDAMTAVSGCGPAFVYMFIEALADGGVEQGLPRGEALRMAAETVAGAAEMVLKTGDHPCKLRDDVCSPGGGTIAGVHALERGGLRAAVMDAVKCSRLRMEELGKQASITEG